MFPSKKALFQRRFPLDSYFIDDNQHNLGQLALTSTLLPLQISCMFPDFHLSILANEVVTAVSLTP